MRKKQIHRSIFNKPEVKPKLLKMSTIRNPNQSQDVMPGVTTDDTGKPIAIKPISQFNKALMISTKSLIPEKPNEIISDPLQIQALKEAGKMICPSHMAESMRQQLQTSDSFNRTKTSIVKSALSSHTLNNSTKFSKFNTL